MHPSNNPFGIFDRSYQLILNALSAYPDIKSACIFGSRAKGNYKQGSDIDIALKGENLDLKILTKLSDELNEELPIPYQIDLLIYQQITNHHLKIHIDSCGVPIYPANPVQ